MKKITILISVLCLCLLGFGQIESDNVIKYKGDLSGDYDDATLAPIGYVNSVSGTVYASQGLTKDADTIKLGGEVGNVILSVQSDSPITIGDSLHYGVTLYNRGDTLTEVDIFAGYANEDIPISSGIAVTTDKITLQSTGNDIITTLQSDTTGVYYTDLPPSSGLTDNHFITKGYVDTAYNDYITDTTLLIPGTSDNYFDVQIGRGQAPKFEYVWLSTDETEGINVDISKTRFYYAVDNVANYYQMTFDVTNEIFLLQWKTEKVTLSGQKTGSLTDGAPTASEITSITGLTSTAAGAGFQVTIKDSDGTGLLYKIESDGTDWHYTVMTKAL